MTCISAQDRLFYWVHEWRDLVERFGVVKPCSSKAFQLRLGMPAKKNRLQEDEAPALRTRTRTSEVRDNDAAACPCKASRHPLWQLTRSWNTSRPRSTASILLLSGISRVAMADQNGQRRRQQQEEGEEDDKGKEDWGWSWGLEAVVDKQRNLLRSSCWTRNRSGNLCIKTCLEQDCKEKSTWGPSRWILTTAAVRFLCLLPPPLDSFWSATAEPSRIHVLFLCSSLSLILGLSEIACRRWNGVLFCYCFWN